MIRIAIFDDNSERLENLRDVFSVRSDMLCVGSFPDCSNISANLADLRPDLVLMDIRMPGTSGIEATRIIKKQWPDIKVVIQTVSDDEDNIFNCLRAGADGYLLKSASLDAIYEQVHEVMKGGAVITPSIAIRITRHLRETVSQEHEALSAREKEVLTLLTEGLSYKLVAAELGISYNTVNAHVRKIYRKLSVNSLQEAVSLTLRKKLL